MQKLLHEPIHDAKTNHVGLLVIMQMETELQMRLQGLDAVAVVDGEGIVLSQHDIHEQAVGSQMISAGMVLAGKCVSDLRKRLALE